MSDPVISVEGLGKSYMVGHRAAPQERYVALRDVLASQARRSASRAMDLVRGRRFAEPQQTVEEFWALKDVNFEVRPGEVLGIVGRNGAGKSTLLKILSRITEPTEGRAVLRGRVASLLEVGTGFHPELTGRENIFLNGAMLGMRRAEIVAKFDEIVAFSEVERFLDTPVKRYSSGMYVRLAFAVAAHLEPEILVVDEVLAVGDSEFQKKCLGKMQDVASSEGRTVIFVSHNMAAVERLCSRCIWLSNGEVHMDGNATRVIPEYSKSGVSPGADGAFSIQNVQGTGRISLLGYRVSRADRSADALPTTGDDVLIEVDFDALHAISRPAAGIAIYNEREVLLTSINTLEQGIALPPVAPGNNKFCIVVKDTSFLPGQYVASFWIMNANGEIEVMAERAINFELAHRALYGTSRVDHRWGCVYSEVVFSHQPA